MNRFMIMRTFKVLRSRKKLARTSRNMLIINRKMKKKHHRQLKNKKNLRKFIQTKLKVLMCNRQKML